MLSREHMNHVSAEMQRCIESCLECHTICETTLMSVLQKGERNVPGERMRIFLDCSELCQTTANFMLRSSMLVARLCGVCAEVCARCASECEQWSDNVQMKACADACNGAADLCREMSAAEGSTWQAPASKEEYIMSEVTERSPGRH